MAGQTSGSWVTLKNVDVLSAAKIGAVLGVIVGLLEGLVFGFVGALFSQLPTTATTTMFNGDFGLLFGGAAIILFPILGAIGGFILTAIYAFVYNLISGWIGGIKVEVKED